MRLSRIFALGTTLIVAAVAFLSFSTHVYAGVGGLQITEVSRDSNSVKVRVVGSIITTRKYAITFSDVQKSDLAYTLFHKDNINALYETTIHFDEIEDTYPDSTTSEIDQIFILKNPAEGKNKFSIASNTDDDFEDETLFTKNFSFDFLQKKALPDLAIQLNTAASSSNNFLKIYITVMNQGTKDIINTPIILLLSTYKCNTEVGSKSFIRREEL